ncbi:hypothetical protein GCK32_008085 [Trichostrongylus colubriformis]|uniref:Uncharacterized protein n=1 Tax=Trichostrongylus colubriformis TaxID=6319 RepID=A0AAN8F640_TRICO
MILLTFNIINRCTKRYPHFLTREVATSTSAFPAMGPFEEFV